MDFRALGSLTAVIFQGDLVMHCDHLFEFLTKLSVIANKQNAIKVIQGRYASRIQIFKIVYFVINNFFLQHQNWGPGWEREWCGFQYWAGAYGLQRQEWTPHGGKYCVFVRAVSKERQTHKSVFHCRLPHGPGHGNVRELKRHLRQPCIFQEIPFEEVNMSTHSAYRNLHFTSQWTFYKYMMNALHLNIFW